MQSSPPKRSTKPSSESCASYYKEGRRALALAQAHYPDLCALDALVRAQEKVPNSLERVLRPSSTRRYREDHRVIVAVLARAFRRLGIVCDSNGALERIEAALKRRRGRPPVPRTASLKVKDAGQAEAEQVFLRLKGTALRHRSRTTAAAAFYIVVVPRLGMRPIELCGAFVDGPLLYLPNAKRGPGQAAWRVLDLGAYPDSFIAAAQLLTVLAPERADVRTFVRWRNALASSLARACTAVPTRRLSLYSCRHVALATWEAAGYTAAEIAALAGHLSLDTAATYYARARSGWANATLPRAVAEMHLDVTGSDIDARTSSPIKLHDIGLDDAPMPEPSPTSLRAASADVSQIATWFVSLQARNEEQAGRSQRDRNSEFEPGDQPPKPGNRNG